MMIRFVLVLFSITLFSAGVSHAQGGIEWNVKKQLKLDSAPIDVAPSPDGKWIYILTSGEVLVYSANSDKIVNKIPVDKGFDRMTFSQSDNALLLTSSAGKKLDIVQLEMVHQFSLDGLPFKGPHNAPVTLIVFSDYQ